jgi:hypothetical protein
MPMQELLGKIPGDGCVASLTKTRELASSVLFVDDQRFLHAR